jgi:hypothetical protein
VKRSSYKRAVRVWGMETAVRLLEQPDSGFNRVQLHNPYVLAAKDGKRISVFNSDKGPSTGKRDTQPEV